MRVLLLLLTALAGLALAGFLYQQVTVEAEFGPAALVGSAILGTFVFLLAVLAYLSGTRHRELVGKLLISLSVTIVSYLTIDFVAGWLLIVPLSPPLVPDQYRHHVLVPDSYADLRQRDFHYIQRTNNLGLRGRDTTVEKPAGTRRILMLGDSFTMGKGVEENETFSVLVEESLRKSLATCGAAVEVINGGVDSYSPILSYIQLDRDLARFVPDLVILNLDHSDLIQEQAYRKQAVRAEDGTIIGVPQVGQDSLYEQFRSWIERNMYLTRVVLVYMIRAMDYQELSVRRVVNELGREAFAHTLEGDIDRTAQWRDIFDSIGNIKRRTDSIPAEFLLTTYPWAHQVNDTDWVPGRFTLMKQGERTSELTQQAIRRHSSALGINLLETLPEFKMYKGSDPLYFNYDPHWTPVGHQVMAGALARYIMEHQGPRWCRESDQLPD